MDTLSPISWVVISRTVQPENGDFRLNLRFVSPLNTYSHQRNTRRKVRTKLTWTGHQNTLRPYRTTLPQMWEWNYSSHHLWGLILISGQQGFELASSRKMRLGNATKRASAWLNGIHNDANVCFLWFITCMHVNESSHLKRLAITLHWFPSYRHMGHFSLIIQPDGMPHYCITEKPPLI